MAQHLLVDHTIRVNKEDLKRDLYYEGPKSTKRPDGDKKKVEEARQSKRSRRELTVASASISKRRPSPTPSEMLGEAPPYEVEMPADLTRDKAKADGTEAISGEASKSEIAQDAKSSEAKAAREEGTLPSTSQDAESSSSEEGSMPLDLTVGTVHQSSGLTDNPAVPEPPSTVPVEMISSSTQTPRSPHDQFGWDHHHTIVTEEVDGRKKVTEDFIWRVGSGAVYFPCCKGMAYHTEKKPGK